MYHQVPATMELFSTQMTHVLFHFTQRTTVTFFRVLLLSGICHHYLASHICIDSSVNIRIRLRQLRPLNGRLFLVIQTAKKIILLEGAVWPESVPQLNSIKNVTVQMCIVVHWQMMLHCLVNGSWHFEGICHLHDLMKVQATHSFKTSKTIYPMTWCHIPEDQNPRYSSTFIWKLILMPTNIKLQIHSHSKCNVEVKLSQCMPWRHRGVQRYSSTHS